MSSHYSSNARCICRGTKETSEDTNTTSNPQTPRIRDQLVCQLDRSSLPPPRVWEYASTSAGLRAPASESEMTSSAQVLIPAPADYNSRQPTMVKLRDPTCSQLNGQITWPRVFAVKRSNCVTTPWSTNIIASISLKRGSATRKIETRTMLSEIDTLSTPFSRSKVCEKNYHINICNNDGHRRRNYELTKTTNLSYIMLWTNICNCIYAQLVYSPSH